MPPWLTQNGFLHFDSCDSEKVKPDTNASVGAHMLGAPTMQILWPYRSVIRKDNAHVIMFYDDLKDQ